MPRLDHRVTPENTVSYETRMLLTIVLQQLNVLRQALDLPLLDAQDARRAVRNYIQEHPRPGSGQGG